MHTDTLKHPLTHPHTHIHTHTYTHTPLTKRKSRMKKLKRLGAEAEASNMGRRFKASEDGDAQDVEQVIDGCIPTSFSGDLVWGQGWD